MAVFSPVTSLAMEYHHLASHLLCQVFLYLLLHCSVIFSGGSNLGFQLMAASWLSTTNVFEPRRQSLIYPHIHSRSHQLIPSISIPKYHIIIRVWGTYLIMGWNRSGRVASCSHWPVSLTEACLPILILRGRNLLAVFFFFPFCKPSTTLCV